MKMNKFIYALAALALVATSCDKFLDVMPDNRTELNNQEKIRAFLTSAYPETDYMLVTEFSSDNVDDYGENNPNHDRFIDQVYFWEDITETDNEDTENLWGNSYIAIAASNQAIEAIDNMGGPEKSGLQAEYAEALLTRAYNHFILVTVFAQAYSKETAATDPGITYMLQPEQGLNPKYERNTVAEVYDFIDKDLQAALPYVSDHYFTVPKYHFNKKAAYAFATRFYLYYENWKEAIKWADACLGTQPSSLLRDWKNVASLTQDEDVIMEHYIDAGLSCNLLLLTAYSKMGLCFGPW
ncbi:MAG: RagB/SusD family nutrient uptake outer membrane protein [Bacteroidales bacterium]|nr:RagB/SusD family nutrient uptake outer membrane protein [Bacteroidales bacterium]